MIRVDFDPATLDEPKQTWWKEWTAIADAATADVIERWHRWLASDRKEEFDPKLDGEIWGRLKEWLLANVFNDKCAYCETRLPRSTYHGDHFRPKKAVAFLPEGQKHQQKAQCTDGCGGMVKHPGYFWLAYAWQNLFPSCGYCNTGEGKKTLFPVRREYVGPYEGHFPNVDELTTREEPYLLDPYRDQPHKHLVFGERGEIAAVEGSEKGKLTIRILDLDGGSLNRERQRAQEIEHRNFFLALIAEKGTVATDKAAEAYIASVEQQREPYSAAVAAYLRLLWRR
jgi:hypothetical protein